MSDQFDDNYGYSGPVPTGISITQNVQNALAFQAGHTPAETFEWFYQMVRNNKDGHLPEGVSMDYKQGHPEYEDLGNFNYAVVGKSLGFPDWVLRYGAGWAQEVKDGHGWVESLLRSALDPANFGDDPKDQYEIWRGIHAADTAGISKSDLGIFGYISGAILDASDLIMSIWGKATSLTYNQIFNSSYLSSRTFVQRRDPLTLDLDGDGLETIGINTANPILFDHNGDGVKTATGWVKSDDGLLVFDRNGNGNIDSGKELFGDATALYAGGTAADGFAALAQEDSNGDGLVNASDAHWGNLQVWRDLNQDGVSQTGELFTLASQGIAALKVAKTANSQTLTNGNQIADLGGFIKTDGSEGTLGNVAGMGDVNLASNPFYSQFTDTIALTDAAQNIADMQGAGMVRSLREAASLDGSLATQVAALAAPLTHAQMMSQVDGIIDGWAATSGMQTSIQAAASKGYTLKYLPPGVSAVDLAWLNLNGDQAIECTSDSPPEVQRRAAIAAQGASIEHLIGVLERFNGTLYVTVGDDGVSTGTGVRISKYNATQSNDGVAMGTSSYVYVPLASGNISLLEQSYAQLKQSVYDGLVVQTRLKPYLDQIALTIGESGIQMDFSAMEASLDARLEADPANAMIDRAELIHYAGQNLNAGGWQGEKVMNRWISDAETQGTWDAFRSAIGIAYSGATDSGNNLRFGTSAADSIDGLAGDDTLFGAGGNDSLYGGDGTDRLYGGNGNDSLYGNVGNDLLDGGAGNDWLYGGTGQDTFVFGKGYGVDVVVADDLSSTGRWKTLQLKDLNVSEVRIDKWNNDLNVTIVSTGEWVALQNFYAGARYQIDAVSFADGTVWDRSTLLAQTTYLWGGSGTDSLTGRDGGANVLNGFDGNDNLSGGNAADQLFGGNGNDFLYGNAGNDSLDGGSGNDYLYGNDGNDFLDGGAGTDRLQGDAGDDTYLFRKGDGSDTVLDWGWDIGSKNVLVFSDYALTDVTLGRSGDNLLFQFANGDTVSLDSYFYRVANWSDQILSTVRFADGQSFGVQALINNIGVHLGDAANTVTFSKLDDKVFGDGGNDTLYGADGNDLLDGGVGDDTLYGGNGNDLLTGGTGNDTLSGDAGNDLLQGMDGTDVLTDLAGSNYFNGGDGADSLTAGAGNDLLVGGTGNDTLTTGDGKDVIAFNKGDGFDAINVGAGSKTASLGGGIAYSDLQFRQTGNDLVLDTGSGEGMTFKNWYSGTTNKNVLNLQVVAEAMAGFDASSADPLLNKKIETFDFKGLASAFDTARVANPGLTSWALTDALTQFQLAASDSAALGGDLAYQYGKNGTLAGIGVTAAQQVVGDVTFGAQSQALQPLAGLQQGVARLS